MRIVMKLLVFFMLIFYPYNALYAMNDFSILYKKSRPQKPTVDEISKELFNKLLNKKYESEINRVLMYNLDLYYQLINNLNNPDYNESEEFNKVLKIISSKINENHRADRWREWCLYTTAGTFTLFVSSVALCCGLLAQ